jgi:transposase-like protein
MGVQHKSSKRKQYSSEFKREAVRLVTEGGLSIAQAARDLGLDDNMVSRWKKEAQLAVSPELVQNQGESSGS